jgi:tRNA(fMet)-specific endonuclease VapC
MEALLASVEIHPLAASASQHYAVLRADLEKRGRLIGSNDLLIAAHCLDLGAALATLNKAEFKRVKSLALYPL